MQAHHLLIIATALAFPEAWAAEPIPINLSDVRIGHTPASRIAKDQSIPGKHEHGKCLEFACNLQSRFQKAGIPSEIHIYRYESAAWSGREGKLLRKPGEKGTHAIVVYKDRGRTYVMDNQTWMPVWVPNGSSKVIARHFSGPGFEVLKTRVIKKNSEV